jgi:hypothetical protein
VRIHVPDLTCMLQPPASSQQHNLRHVPHRRSAQQPEPGASAEAKGECRAGKPRAAFQSDWVIAPRYYCHHLQHTDSLTHQHARRLLDPPLETSPSHLRTLAKHRQASTTDNLHPRPSTDDRQIACLNDPRLQGLKPRGWPWATWEADSTMGRLST